MRVLWRSIGTAEIAGFVMHTSTLLLYLIAVSAVMITPGPSMLWR